MWILWILVELIGVFSLVGSGVVVLLFFAANTEKLADALAVPDSRRNARRRLGIYVSCYALFVTPTLFVLPYLLVHFMPVLLLCAGSAVPGPLRFAGFSLLVLVLWSIPLVLVCLAWLAVKRRQNVQKRENSTHGHGSDSGYEGDDAPTRLQPRQ